MKGEWPIVQVEKIARRLATGPFGSAISSKHFLEHGVPVIRGSNLSQDVETRLNDDGLVFVSEEKAAEFRRSAVGHGDLIFTCWGTIDQVGLVDDRAKYDRYIVSNKQMLLTPDNERADSLFLYYYFASPQVRESILNQGIGSSVPGFNLGQLRSFEVPLPPLPTQRAIAHILGTLDDKIELNRRMNATLESMSRALFQSWFVDFDPVRAKMDGRRPAGMDAETAALFPDSFEESELGLIPKGWEVDTIRARASKIQYGFTQSATPDAVGPRFLRITDIRGGHIDWQSVPYCKATGEELEKYLIKDGDIFIARTGASTGDNAYVVEPPPAVFASYLIRVQFSNRGVGRIVGEFTRTNDYATHVSGALGGSAQPNANAQTLTAASLVFPCYAVAERFYNVLRPIDLAKAQNETQSCTLATLRDTLLPKLLSGELSVKHAEKLLEGI